jgi:HD-GYP domain-containing protein (c-di-GMP phosphodiesterase class II)
MSESVQKLAHTFAALADLGQEISESSDLDVMAKTSLHLVLGSLAIMRGGLAEFDADEGLIHLLSSRGLSMKEGDTVTLSEKEIAALKLGGIRVVLSLSEADSAEECEWPEWVSDKAVSGFIPLLVRNNLLGVIFLGGKATGEKYTNDDREILAAMARHIAVGLQEHRNREELERRAQENRLLYDGMRAIYKDTVRAFAAAIDCKDKYTQGHSQRVGRYSEIIAIEMGWSDEEVEGIAIAGYLHDIGKLVVDRDIINAPYRIDAKQSSELNRHPAAGFEILSPIRHPYADIPLMARHHHERLDGRGYPDGLTADEIPMGVKIVTLADSFDAMTTDRPYRRRRSMQEVVEDLRRNTGKQFAHEVVVALCRALLKELTGEKRERLIVKMLGKEYVSDDNLVEKLRELIGELEPRGLLGDPRPA